MRIDELNRIAMLSILRNVSTEELLTLMLQLYEAGFSHGAGSHIKHLQGTPYSESELAELISFLREQRYNIESQAILEV